MLLVPQRSPVDSRSDVDLPTNVTLGLRLSVSLVSVAVDTVTETKLAGTPSGLSGLGIVYRFLDVDEQAEQVRHVAEAGGTVAGTVGINEGYLDRTEAPLGAGADTIVMDITHGHVEPCLDAVERIRDEFDPEIVAGNVVTPAAIEDPRETGAGCMKASVGPGSHCTTREVAGAGCPQLTAVSECTKRAHDLGIHVMTDGGVRTFDDAARTPMVDIGTVVMDSFFAGTDKALGRVIKVDDKTYKCSRRMASTETVGDCEDKQSDVDTDEGVKVLTLYEGPVESLVEEFLDGIRSGVSYCDDHTLVDARKKAFFACVATGAKEREGAHGVVFVEGSVKIDEEAGRELQAPMAD